MLYTSVSTDTPCRWLETIAETCGNALCSWWNKYFVWLELPSMKVTSKANCVCEHEAFLHTVHALNAS